MLIPRFTVRRLLAITSICGLFSWVLAIALNPNVEMQNKAWAVGISIAVGSLVVAFVCYAAFFGFAYILATVFGIVREKPVGGTPFASEQPPPQIIPPQEPE